MLKFAIWIIGLLAIVYIALCGFLYWTQERLIFPGASLDYRDDYAFNLSFEETSIPVDDATINIVRFPAESPKGVILYLHGNGDIIARLEPIASYFVSLGYDVVIPDYRGYGKSGGTINNEAALHADMEAVYRYLLTTDPEESIIIYGQSLGTGLAVGLAAAFSPKRLILESPYYSMADLVSGHVPLLPSFLLKYKLRSDQHIGMVTSPVSVIHGGRDTLIPLEQGERLYGLIKAEKEFLLLPDAGHGPLLGVPELRAFLEQKALQ